MYELVKNAFPRSGSLDHAKWLQKTQRVMRSDTISAKLITVLTRYRPIVLELI